MAWTDWINRETLAVGIVSFVVGNLIAFVRRRVRTLEYSVFHNRVGFSENDQIFGAVQISWNNHPAANLYLSTVEIVNDVGIDLQNMDLRIYTGDDTLLLTQRADVHDTPYIVEFEPGFAESIRVAAGQAATESQLQLVRHNRIFRLPVMNRGQRVTFKFLTSAVPGMNGPNVHAATQHAGIRLAEQKNVDRRFGAPVIPSVLIGLAMVIITTSACALLIDTVWVAALISAVVASCGQLIGAYIYRAFRIVWSIVAS